MNKWQPTREWEEPEELPVPTITKNISYFLNADDDEFDAVEALTFLKETKMELAIHYATIEALKKLETKIKEYIRETGDVPDVPHTVVKFGKPSVRTYVYTKMLQESAEKDPVPWARNTMEELAPFISEEGQALFKEIRVALANHIPLKKYLYNKDISPSIKIET